MAHSTQARATADQPPLARNRRELRESGYASRSVKQELRGNLIRRLESGEPLFTGIVGYDQTVLPQIENALLSGQDIVFLGERGQGKTRMARSLVALLDPWMPAISGCEINDDPFNPICRRCLDLVAEHGDQVEIDWIGRERRYGEKLATPDITIADLIGEVDPIKVAEGRYLSDELTIHYGLLPRTHRGIFVLNELPDLAERIQVGLLNVMEERDVQIRGYKVRLPIDVYVVASANPEDYTNRGRIITPLKDRFGSQIRTHDPRTIEHEMDIMEQERGTFADEAYLTVVPQYMREIVAEVTHLARRSPEISQRSGVSVRVSVANYENLVSSALKRAIRLREQQVAPRIADLMVLAQSTTGKIEVETVGDRDDEKIVEKLVQRAVLNVFNRHFSLHEFDELLVAFANGLRVDAGENLPSLDYVRQVAEVSGFSPAIRKLDGQGNPALIASAVEFVLEGLHLSKKLNKDRAPGQSKYRA
ncbi:MAG: sigma 54-interacting transcriptional regulator [Chloroflexi bacterium]|nr:sigma 54-interacting transcriptional regulator [Chloroflexota bacterium]